MSMGRREERQAPMWLAGTELARSPGHRFYEKLNELLSEAKFDARVERLCAPYFEALDKPGRPSIPPATAASSSCLIGSRTGCRSRSAPGIADVSRST